MEFTRVCVFHLREPPMTAMRSRVPSKEGDPSGKERDARQEREQLRRNRADSLNGICISDSDLLEKD